MNFKSLNYKPLAISVIAIVGFLVLSLLYFSPIFDGKTLQQHDVMQYQGMARESLQYEEETGHAPLWTNTLFGGMPTYLIHIQTKNVVTYIYQANLFFHVS